MEKGTDIYLVEIAFLILRNIPNEYSKEEEEYFTKGVISMSNVLSKTLNALKENSNMGIEDVEEIIKKEINNIEETYNERTEEQRDM